MPLSDSQVETLAQRLVQAESTRSPVAPLTEEFPDMTQEEAYAVQRLWVQAKVSGGAKLIGWKVGLTSEAMQRMFGVTTPDFGQLLDYMPLDDGALLSLNPLIQPRIEPEIAFVLNADIQGPGIKGEDVLAATEAVMPALEIIDSRIADWKIKLADTISDNASCGRIVLSRSRQPPQGIDLSQVQMQFTKDSVLISSATGAAVLGNPANAVAWLANTLAPLGESLKAGQIIMPGSLVGAVPAETGCGYVAEFEGLGSVGVKVG